MQTVYTIVFLAAFMMLIMLITLFKNKISVYYSLLFACVVVSNFGFMQSTSATNLEMAVYANQIQYLGGCFLPFFLCLCMADLCKAKVKTWLFVLLGTWSGIVFAFASTIGLTDVYYKEVGFVIENGMGKMIKIYGPAHVLYPGYIFFTAACCLYFIVRAIRRKADVSFVTSFMLLVCMLISIGGYALERVLPVNLQLVPIVDDIALLGVLILLRRISLYDVSAMSADSMVESAEYGVAIFDSNGKYLGGDEAAKQWFPELCTLAIDAAVPAENTDFLKQVGSWVRKEDEAETVQIKQGDRYIEARHTILYEKKRKSVHCVHLRDDTKQQEYTKLIERYNETLAHDVNVKTEKMRKIQDDIIVSMANTIENRDNRTGGHVARTSDVVKIFVECLQNKKMIKGLTPEVANCIIKAAPLHDFGKIAIPDVVLNKPGKFTDEEYEIMKQHSAKGAVIVEKILQHSDDALFRTIAVNVAHYHHEKWDGRGYPEGIKEAEIPFEARVMALADVFDALVSKRVYKDRYGYDKAFLIIEESAGSHFDPILCKAFLTCRPELEALYDSYEDY